MQPNILVQSVSEVSLCYAAGRPGMPAWAAAETLVRRLGKAIANTDVDYRLSRDTGSYQWMEITNGCSNITFRF